MISSNSFWSGLLKLIQTLSTAVKIKRKSAFNSDASSALDLSLSITASTPTNLPFLLTTGIPPPPTVITVSPASTILLIASISTMCNGFGEGTTFLYPLPESSTKVNPFSLSNSSAFSFV